ncbi:alkylhydroperoxidase family enzyme [Rhizobium sp. SJZ105]|uniref:carboxymuconolactone decarboxylase family protein n=1 Tax=Rhizobium sp. SJZ105 TaxID=2572678 RepID=UPI0011A69D3D|nr:carboxymuconolactone decarboxylase family protein [Rhizobium sp. SJZ105]TWC76446.1 alkylhydroperoxidase family enzyme [Rhizobium sp. SJZ105]
MKLKPIENQNWPQSLEALKRGFAGQLNVYRTMAHHPALLGAWAPLRDHVVVRSTLGSQFSEIVILRAGMRLGSSYEWAHHVSRARACGVSDERIASIAGPLETMEPADEVLASAVDDLFARHALSPTSQERLVNLVGVTGMLDLMATVGFYTTLGFILKSFDVPLDSEIAAEMQRDPLDLPG